MGLEGQPRPSWITCVPFLCYEDLVIDTYPQGSFRILPSVVCFNISASSEASTC